MIPVCPGLIPKNSMVSFRLITVQYCGICLLAVIINPATIYIVFRTSGLCWNKARRAGNGDSIGKRRNAVPAR